MTAVTLNRFLFDEQGRSGLEGSIGSLIERVADACKAISHTIARGELGGVLGALGTQNVQGEVQKKLDVIANDMMLEANSWGGDFSGIASEEMNEIQLIPAAHPEGDYLLLFDPIDGSSNIDVGLSVGTIFSVLRAPNGPCRNLKEADFLQSGRDQVAAGYVIYGPQTILVLTVGRGVFEFTLDREVGSWFLTTGPIRIPLGNREFAINIARARQWSPAIVRYIEERLSGSAGPAGHSYNMRWTGSMVADVHRILKRGGIFLYPSDHRDGTARLRLLYEANPMAFLVEQAGGSAHDGFEPILELRPEHLHQRVGTILGDLHEAATILEYGRQNIAETHAAEY